MRQQKPSSLEFLVTEAALLTTLIGISLGLYHIKNQNTFYKSLTELSIGTLTGMLTLYLIYKNIKRK